MNPLFILLPPLLAVAGFTEVKERRIPNWLTLSGVVCGLMSSLLVGGLDGLSDSFIGMLVGGGAFLPFCLAGAMGGGDFKLMAAVGSIVGYPFILTVLYYTCFAGGVLGLLYLIWSGQLLIGLASTFKIMLGRKKDDSVKPIMVPYGIAIAVGVIWAVASTYSIA